MMLKNKGLTVLLIWLALVIISLINNGCTSSILAPKLTKEEQTFLEKPKEKLVIGVKKYKYEVYSDNLILALKKTDLFAEVDYMDSLSATADLIAAIERPVYGTAVIPIIPLITLGIVPIWSEEEHGFDFSLQEVESIGKPIKINCTYSGTSYMGLVSLVLNLSPNRVGGIHPQKHQRYYDQLEYQVASALIENGILKEIP